MASSSSNLQARDVDQVKRDQSLENLHEWLSPPDPSTNHNIASGAHHEGTATWLFQDSIFNQWKSTPSLLWIHGKSGSGKSVLCSAIIQNIQAMCEAGEASMSYFYLDFRDTSKQHLHDLASSFLTQLSAKSSPRYSILSRFYANHDNGTRQPSDDALVKCLEKMVTLPDQGPVYLIIDALDECPSTSLIPSPRERVLQLLKGLVDLRLPNVHICATSRPEIDICHVLEPLTTLRMALHDQGGQKEDIVKYIRSIVYSDSEQIMERWRTEDKELVIETLSKRADGRFRLVYCQLETLRHCLPSRVQHALSELPESLDETYERILRTIKKPSRDHIRRLLQCLLVAIRPLRVEELGEVLAVDFDDAEGIPKLNPSWRWEDEEQALLLPCSSLIAINNIRYSRVVQFSHSSVKEFLTSPRIASLDSDISRYHINREPAHTTLAQTCLSILLQAGNHIGKKGIGNSSLLAGYAAQHWVAHAKFGNVVSHLKKLMEFLFDPDEPHFSAWVGLHDIDVGFKASSPLSYFVSSWKFDAAPLYYAALCGFQDLVEHLIFKYPRHVNAFGGYYTRPIVAALAGRHFKVAQLLFRNGSSVNVQNSNGQSPLHSAAYYGDLEVVGALLQYKADIQARDYRGETAMLIALQRGQYTSSELVRLLLEYGADPNTQKRVGETQLSRALQYCNYKVVRVLLEYGADPKLPVTGGLTPLHHASQYGRHKVAYALLKHGADPNAQTTAGETPLHLATGSGVTHVLLKYGADPHTRMPDGETPLHHASQYGEREVAHLLKHGADPTAQRTDAETPLHRASRYGQSEVVRLLLEHGVDPNAQMTGGETALHRASMYGRSEAAQVLLGYGADPNSQTTHGETPLHYASRNGRSEVARVLLEHNADLNAQMTDNKIPLHLASLFGTQEVVRLLLRHGANLHRQTTDGKAQLHPVSQYGKREVAQPFEHGADPTTQGTDSNTPLHHASEYGKRDEVIHLLDHGADPNARRTDGETPLHRASRYGRFEVAKALLEHGADPNKRMMDGDTPLHRASRYGRSGVAQVLLRHGADPNATRTDGETPLHCASRYGRSEVARVLLEHHANRNAQRTDGETPLHRASRYGLSEVVQVLLEHNADPNVRRSDGETPLHRASRYGWSEVARMLLEGHADPNAQRTDGKTPLHRVSRYCQSDVARVLLERGADPNAPRASGETPFHRACRYGRSRIAQVLLEHGADPTAPMTNRETPSRLASESEVVDWLLEYGARVAE